MSSISSGIDANIAYMQPDDDLFSKEKPYVSLVPFLSDGASFTNTTVEEHMMHISNVRGRETCFDLDHNGFTYVSYESKEQPTHEIKGPDHPYMREMATFLQGYLGAESVTIYDANTRKVGDPEFLQASTYAHVDHSKTNARWRFAQFMAERNLEKVPKRWQFINLWVPIKGPVLGSSLAVCDYQSIDRKDLVAVDTIFPHRVMEIYHVQYNPKHRWYFLDQQDVNDVLIFKTCDSDEESASCCVHSAVLPEPGNEIVRESLELRAIVVY